MLEKQLSVFLARKLSCYISDLNEDQIRVSLWSGNLVLKDVHLKPDILEQIALLILQYRKRQEKQGNEINDSDSSHDNSFEECDTDNIEDAAAAQTLLMPLIVVKGLIRELTLRVPWPRLDQEQVSIEVKGVELVLAPLRSGPFNHEEEEARQSVILQDQLNLFEKERDAANITMMTKCEEDPKSDGVQQKSTTSGGKPSMYANTKKPRSPSDISSIFNLHKESTAVKYVEKIMQSFFANAHLSICCVSIQYIFDYPGLQPKLAASLSIFIDEISATPTGEPLGEYLTDEFSTLRSRAVTVKDLRIAVHKTRTSKPKLTTLQKVGALAATESCSAKLASLKHPMTEKEKGDNDEIGSFNIQKCFQCVSEEWEHTEVLLEFSDALLNIKVGSDDGVKLPNSKKNTQEKNSKNPRVACTYDSSSRARTVLEVIFGSLVRSQVSFGALLALKTLVCSFKHGLVGAPHRKYLYLLDNNADSKLVTFIGQRRWAFVLACVRNVIQKQKQRLPSSGNETRSVLEAMMDFCKVRRSYCELFKRQDRVSWLPPLDPQERDELGRLERQLTIEQILFLRCLSRAELGMEAELHKLQKQLIASAAALRTKTPISSGRSVTAEDPMTEKTSRKGLLGWIRWGRNEESQPTISRFSSTDTTQPSALTKDTKLSTSMHTPNPQSNNHKALLLQIFHAEWSVARRYLAHLGTPDLKPRYRTLYFSELFSSQPTLTAKKSTVTCKAQSSGLSLLMLVRCNTLEVSFVPRYWVLDRSDIPTTNFFAHLDQKLHVRLNNVEWFLNTVQEPQDDRSGLSIFVKSFSAGFSGTFNTPLLLSSERDFPKKEENEDFLVVKRNATCTRMTVMVSPFLMIVRPTHEMLWWSNEIFQFWSVLSQSYMRTTFSTSLSAPQADPPRDTATDICTEESPVDPFIPIKPFPLLSVSLASFDVLVPLFLNDCTSAGPNLKDSISCNTYPLSSELESHQAYTIPESNIFTQPPHSITEIEPEVGSYFEPDTKLFSGLVGVVQSDQGLGNEFSSPSFNYIADQSQFFDEPYLVLSIPCVTIKTVRGPQKRYKGQEDEIGISIGEKLRGVRLYCQPGNMRHQRLSPKSTLEILSVASICILVNPSEVSIGLYNGAEVSIEPYVIALLNDLLLRPCILYDSQHQSKTESIIYTLHKEWNESSNPEGVLWHFASPERLCLNKNGTTKITVPPHHGREYATLLYRWMTEHHVAPTYQKVGKSMRVQANDTLRTNTRPASCRSKRTYSFCIEFTRVFLRSFSHEDVVVVELMRPVEIPEAFPEYRHFFENFSKEAHALEMMVSPTDCTCFGSLADVTITNGADKSLSTIQSLYVIFSPESKALVYVNHLSFYLREEFLEGIELILAAAKTFDLSTCLRPQQTSQLLPNAASSDFHVSSGLLDMSWRVEFNTLLVELPYSKLMDYPYRAFSVIHKDFQINYSADGQVAHINLTGYITKALRIEEDVAFEEVNAPFVVLGPSIGLSGFSEELHYVMSLRWPLLQTLAVDTGGPECSLNVSGGHIALYIPFLMQSLDSASNSFYTKFFNLGQSSVVRCGLSLSPNRWPTSTGVESHATDDTAKPKIAWHSIQFCVIVSEMDVLLASNSNLPIDISDESTYFYLHLGELCVYSTGFSARNESCPSFNSSTSGTMSKLPGSISMDIKKILYSPFSGQLLSPLLMEVGLVLTFQALLELKEDLTGYEYTVFNKGTYFTLLIDVHPVDLITRQKTMRSDNQPYLSNCAADIDVIMSADRIKTLFNVIKFNLMMSSFSNTNGGSTGGIASRCQSNSLFQTSGFSLSQSEIPQHDIPRASLYSPRVFSSSAIPSSGFAIVLMMSSLRLGVVTEDQQLICLKVLSGIQNYCARGGKWSQHVVVNLQIRDLIIDAVEYEMTSLETRDAAHTPCLAEETQKGRGRGDAITGSAQSSLDARPLLEVRLMGATMVLAENILPCCGQQSFPFHVEVLTEDTTVYTELDLWLILINLLSDFVTKQPSQTNALGNQTVLSKYRPQHISENVSCSGSEAVMLNFPLHSKCRSQFSLSSTMVLSSLLGTAVTHSELKLSLKNTKVLLKEPWEETLALFVLPRCSICMTQLCGSIVRIDAVAAESPSFLVNMNQTKKTQSGNAHSASLTPVLYWNTPISPAVEMPVDMTESFISFSATLNRGKREYQCLDEPSHGLPTFKIKHSIDIKTHDLHICYDLVILSRLMHFGSEKLIPAFQESVRMFTSRSHEPGSINPSVTTPEIGASNASCSPPIFRTVSCEILLHRIVVHFPFGSNSMEKGSNKQWELHINHLSAMTAVDISKIDFTMESCLLLSTAAKKSYMLYHVIKVNTNNVELHCDTLYPILLPSFSVDARIPISYGIFFDKLDETTETSTSESSDTMPVCDSRLRWLPLSSVANPEAYIADIFVKTTPASHVFVSPNHIHDGIQIISTLMKMQAHAATINCDATEGSYSVITQTNRSKADISFTKNSLTNCATCHECMPFRLKVEIVDLMLDITSVGTLSGCISLLSGAKMLADVVSLKSLARLHIVDPLILCFDQNPYSETVCMQLSLMGHFVVMDGNGTRILFHKKNLETFPTAKQGLTPMHGSSSPRTIEFTSSIDCYTQCISSELSISCVWLNLSPVTYEFALCMSQLVWCLLTGSDGVGNTISTGILNYTNPQSSPSSLVDPPCYPQRARMSLSIKVDSFGLCIENVAMLLLRSIYTDASTLQLIYSRLTRSANNNIESQAQLENSCDILVGEMLLLQDGESKFEFLHVKSTEIQVWPDRINIMNNHLDLNNYSVPFLIELMEHIVFLTTYVLKKLSASHRSSQNQFGPDLYLNFVSFCVCFHCLNSPLPSENYVETYFPNITFTYVNNTLRRRFNLEVEDGVLSWVFHPAQSHFSSEFTAPRILATESLVLVTPIKASLLIEDDKVRLSRVLDLCVFDMECVLPVGSTLQLCMGAIAQFVSPLVLSLSSAQASETSQACRATLFNSKNRSEVPNSEQHKAYTFSGVNDSAIHSISTPSERHTSHPIVFRTEQYTFRIQAINVHVKSVNTKNGVAYFTLKVPLIANSHTLLSVCFQNIEWVHSTNFDHGDTLRFQIGAISSTVHLDLQDNFIMAQTTHQESFSYADSMAALYICKQAAPSSINQIQTSSVLCYAQDFKLAVSTNLLSFLNNEVLAHLAMGMSRIRDASSEWEAHRHSTQKAFSACKDSSSHATHNIDGSEDSVISIYTDMYLRQDVCIGGRQGKKLHFVKDSFLGRSPQNIIRVTSANQARLLLFPSDLSQGERDVPIIIDEGITVVVEDTLLILYDIVDFKAGANVVQNYATLGPRSLFIVPEELVLIFSPDISQKKTLPLPSVTSLNDEVGTRFDLNVLLNLRLQMCSLHQNISVDAKISAQYFVEKKMHRDEANGEAAVVNECGEVTLHSFSMACEGRRIDTDPIHFTLRVQHHRSLESDAKLGFTAIHGILSPVKILATMDNLRLITTILSLLSEGHIHIKAAMGLETDSWVGVSGASPVNRRGKDASGREVNHETSIQVGLTIPSVELVLLNNFSKPLLMCNLCALACQASGSRDMSSVSCRCTGVLTLIDYPAMGLPPRLLLRLSPEITVDYVRYDNNGVSLSGCLSLPEIFLTIPVITLLRLVEVQKTLQDQCMEPNAFFFRNELGVPLILMPAETSGLAFPSQTASIQTQNIPVGSCVKISLLDYNQTNFRVLVADEKRHDQLGFALGFEDTIVDISTLEHGSTHRFPIHELSIGTMDAVFRLDEATRLVRITTSVSIRNNMTSRAVTLPCNGQAKPLLLLPMQSSPVELEVLTYGFMIQVDEYMLPSLSNSTFLPFKSIIGAFLLLLSLWKAGVKADNTCERTPQADTDKRFQRTQNRLYWDRVALIDSDTLILPVTLNRNLSQEGQDTKPQQSNGSFQLIVNLVFKRKLARETISRTLRLLPKSEVEVIVEPVVSMLNCTGNLLGVELFVLSLGGEDAATSLSSTDFFRSVARSNLLTPGERFEWYPNSPEMLVHSPFAKLELYTCGDEPQCIMRSIDYFNLSFNVECFSRMQSAECLKISCGALTVQKLSETLLVVKELALLVNHLPVPIRPFDDSLNSLMFGGKSQNQALGGMLLPGQQCPLLFHCDADGNPPTKREFFKPLRARIAVGSPSAKPSQPFVCPSISVPVFLSSEDNGCEWIFMASNEDAKVEVMMLESPEKVPLLLPLIILRSAWTLHNTHASLGLRLRFVGLHCNEDVLVQPLQGLELCRFGLGSYGNPEVHFRFETLSVSDREERQGVDTSFLFEWSDSLKLASLAESMLPITVKHRLCVPDSYGSDIKTKKATSDSSAKVQSYAERLFRHHNVYLFTNTCTPKYYKEEPEDEVFTCFTLTPRIQGQQCTFDVSLGNKPPLVIENRTSYTIQFNQKTCSKASADYYDVFTPSSSSQSALGYIIRPYTDVATCLEVASLSSPVLHLIINTQHAKGREFECTVNLGKAVATKGAIKVGSIAFVFVTQDYQSRCFFVTITENRMFETQLLFQPHFVAHVNMLVHHASIFLASTCVPEKSAHPSNTAFDLLLKQWDADSNYSVTTEFTDAEKLNILKVVELNFTQVCITSLLIEVSWNERHALAGLHINELSVMDCTSLSPTFPTVLHLGVKKGGVLQTKGPLENQSSCFSLKLHLLRAGRLFSRTGNPLGLEKPSMCSISTNPTRTRNAVGSETQVLGKLSGGHQSSEIRTEPTTIFIEELHLTCPMVQVCLQDDFLYVVRQAVESVMKVYRLSQSSLSPDNQSVHLLPSTYQSKNPTPYQCVLWKDNIIKDKTLAKHAMVVYEFYIARILVSITTLRVSLKRRTRSSFSPYEGLIDFPVPSIEKALFTIGGFCFQNISHLSCSPWFVLFPILWPSYRLQFILQFYKVIGALEVLSNPIAVMNAWGRGVRSLLKEGPHHDFSSEREEFLQETPSSTLDSIGLSRTGGQNFAALSLDKHGMRKQHDFGGSTDPAVLPTGVCDSSGASQSILRRNERVPHGLSSSVRLYSMTGLLKEVTSGMVSLGSRPITKLFHGIGSAADLHARQRAPERFGLTPKVLPVSTTGSARRQNLLPMQSFHVADHLLTEIPIRSDSLEICRSLLSERKDRSLFLRDSIRTHEFISVVFYNQIVEKATNRLDKKHSPYELSRAIIEEVGPHNYALHASYHEFLRYATPEEFYHWIDVALDAHLAYELNRLLNGMNSKPELSDFDNKNICTNMKNKEDIIQIEKLQNIKTFMGVSSLLKYATVDEFVKLCTLDEIKVNVSMNDLQNKFAMPLLEHRCEIFKCFLRLENK
ncbi:unnamed protein product [Phytomonas sp. Hart1]|nr:unnamed protein product [Phytomonas sp. Hart1]|eukprot:CCW67012.1 unnamed protein product [Phytomonas sp. isolate Hart1]